MSYTTTSGLQDIRLTSVDEALDLLLTRTTRVTRIIPSREAFRLRLRSFAFCGIHLSRTWESNATFETNGRAVPVIFFPVSQATTIRRGKREDVHSARSVGSFSIVEPGIFQPVQGYSEVVLRFDEDLLARYLRLLDIDEPLAQVLSRAALRDDLPGLRQLRRAAFERLDEVDTQIPKPLRLEFYRVQEEMLALQAAAILATLYRSPEAKGSYHPGLGRAVEFIRLNFQSRLLMKQIAEAAGTSIRLLQLLFRQHLDCTPGEYIRRLRLEQAHRLLSQQLTASVTEAALESGFDHLGEFSAAYTKQYGERPSETLRQSKH
jgi:AraC-like DNA-binding protein